MSAGYSSSPPLSIGLAAGRASAPTWRALHRAAEAVAGLAGLDPEPQTCEVDGFPAALAAAGGWRRALAEQGIDDLAAIMAPGIAALLAAHARGTRCPAAALALWHEFLNARTALLALAPPVGSETHRLA